MDSWAVSGFAHSTVKARSPQKVELQNLSTPPYKVVGVQGLMLDISEVIFS